MPTIQESLKRFFSKTIEDIRLDQQAKGMKASGQSSDSLRVETTTDSGRLIGSISFRFQRDGRGPGGFPPVQNIQDWIRAKGIQTDSISIESLAYLIGRKIARQGSDIFMGRKPGLDIDGAINKNIPELKKSLLKGTKERIIKRI